MADLLKRLMRQNVAVGYIGKFPAAFGDDEQVVVPEASISQATPTPSISPPSPPPQPLIEPLTNRELEILELLAQRRQNKEIAEKLFISTETVKSHLKNIYGKLNISNRRQAVEKAKKIGIL
jgi:LuxR family maltose regulon positive regulatory protein